MNDTPEQEEPMDTTQGNEGTPGEPAAAPPPPATTSSQTQTSRRPIYRSRADRWIAGVAGGLGEYFRVDPLIIRILFVGLTLAWLVGLTFAWALGIIFYLVAWALIPEEGSDRAAGQDLIDRARDAPSWLAILLIVIGAAIAIGHFAYWGGAPVLWGAVLIGAGIWLYRRPDIPPPPAPVEPPTETQPDAGSRSASGAATQEMSSTVPASTQTQRMTARRARRRRSSLGRLTIAAGLVVVGVIAMLHNAGVVTVAPKRYPAIALLIIGTGLLVGSLWGRSRGLVFLGLLFVPFALTASLFRVPLQGGTGERTFTPTSVAETAKAYRLGAGQMNIDLTGMDWSQPVKIIATIGLGELDVTVPFDVRVEVHSQVAAGSIVAFGEERSGTNVVFDKMDGNPTTTKTLVLDARASFGQIQIDRATASMTTPDGGAQ